MIGFLSYAFLSTLSLRRATCDINIHSITSSNFYPRSPCGERRITDGSICLDSKISIHALLAESDAVTTLGAGSVRDFYPRSPCGERPIFLHPLVLILQFLSTLSLRRATISIVLSTQPTRFLSTLSLRRATIFLHPLVLILQFLSTLSLRRATCQH